MDPVLQEGGLGVTMTAPSGSTRSRLAAGPVTSPAGWRQPPGPSTLRPPLRARPEATVALFLLTLASCAGLLRVFSRASWLAPVVATVVTVHVTCWILRRGRIRALASVLVIVVTLLVMTTWTVFGRYTDYGLPGRRVWNQVSAAMRDFGGEVASMVPRVTPTRAFEMLTVLGVGVAAALADWAAFRWRQPLAAVVPGLAVFIFCCVAGVGSGRGLVVAVEVAAVCLFLVVERATGEVRVWFAGIRSGVGAWSASIGAMLGGLAVIAALALSPALSPRDGTAVLGWKGGFGSGSGTRIVANPLVDLQTRLTRFQNVPVFVVTSSVPSYWRLTSLDQFDGVTWQSSGEYNGFGSRLPGSPPPGTNGRTVRATFQIQQLDSDWLPAQFDPVAVQGVRGVTYDAGSNSLLAPKVTSPHLEYSVTSYQSLASLSSAVLEAAPALSLSDPTVQRNLQLPVLDSSIDELAARITSGATTEYQKALAIQTYLRGPLFTYSLSPPSDGSGTQAISNFLFETRTGYCQQFAGAYAVLARAVGLPTRLAVGFVEGQAAGAGSYQVRDMDAHTWPEVYFGSRLGWVPFEPTKGFAVPGTGGYSGTADSPVNPVSSTPTTVPGSSSSSSTLPGSASHPTQKTVPPVASAGSVAHHSGGSYSWWLLIPVLIVAWPAANWGAGGIRRRARRARAGRAGPRPATLNAWREVGDQLQWLGIGRSPDETDDEFARRASAALRRMGLDLDHQPGDLRAMAGLVHRAAFAPDVPDELGRQAVEAAAHAGRALRKLTPPGRRLIRLWMFRPGTWHRTVDALHPAASWPTVS